MISTMPAEKNPRKVLITGGREVGGVTAFANSLADGFQTLGIESTVLTPGDLLRQPNVWRDQQVLKILSTTGVFLTPLMKGSICVAHGFPRADAQGWIKSSGIVLSLKLANHFSKLTAVSSYVGLHLSAIFDLHIDAVIKNPLNSDYFVEPNSHTKARNCITFVGRLHAVKNLHRLLKPAINFIDAHPELSICIVGDGPEKQAVAALANLHPRVQMLGTRDKDAVRELLGRTAVFFSGCETEALGIAYLEALSQGACVVMPACGGGLEIAPSEWGHSVQTFPLSFDEGQIVAAFERAFKYSCERPNVPLDDYRPASVARQYLEVWRSSLAESP